MKPNLAIAFLLSLLAGGLRANAQDATQDTNSAPKPAMDPYEIILHNNAFNESRVAGDYDRGGPRVPRVQTITKLGQVIDNGDGVAWFSGSGVRDTKDYHVGDTLVGFKISRITIDTVTVTNSSSNTYVITENNPTLRRDEDGPWRLTGYTAPVPTPGTNSTESALSAMPTGNSPSDILQRLKMKRLQE